VNLRIALPAGDGFEPALSLLRRVRPDWTRASEGGEGAVVAIDERDVGAFVAAGALALGVAPKDRLAESRPRVAELLDLRLLPRRLVLAAPLAVAKPGGPAAAGGPAARRRLRVATSHPRLAGEYFTVAGERAELVTLAGPLAPALDAGLADAVVGIVPGDDVPDGCKVEALLLESSLRLIVARGARVHASGEVAALLSDLRTALEDA
jgi:ATP phosphoribosyltransferase